MITEIIKNHKKLFVLFSVFSLILLFAGSIMAVKMMNAVPQEIGFKDLQFSNLTRPI